MDEPSTGVIGFESDGDEAVGREKNDVPAGWIVEFEVELACVESLVGLLEEGEVVAVEVDLRG